jgi:hypothetical protein
MSSVKKLVSCSTPERASYVCYKRELQETESETSL